MSKLVAETNHLLTEEEGNEIVELLRSQKMTQAQLAKKIGIGRTSVGEYLRRRCNPSPYIAALIREALQK